MLLSKGPKFAPSGKFNQKVLSRISMGFVSLAATLRTRAASRSQNGITWDTLPPIPFPPAHFFLHPKSDKTDQQVAAAFNIFMKKINEQKCLHIADNMSKKMWSALKELGQNKDINITVSDKRGEFVITTNAFYRESTILHLTDTSVYTKITKTEYNEEVKKFYGGIESVLKSWNKKTADRLTDCHPSKNTLYILYKTHKFEERGEKATPSNTKVRPIISGVGGPTDRPSWVVCTIISQLLQFVGCHLQNTNEILKSLNDIRGKKIKTEIFYESFDVESLYTNIDNEAAYEVVITKLKQHYAQIKWYGVSFRDIKSSLKTCLNFNAFVFNEQHYVQKRGLAMGSRLAPVLAILYMDKLESLS
ncbi:hypothetical protein CRE_13686 [Caenorhabditis remanei]|uniref:Reverse transcriptase domain-containing protein n=1 Tax=Caenorhabditis remanei TaxID=31234 RepID=E3N7K3_CAERE|nr:hypothetical protein CRE_13686 [Caenorhabditis remanei]